MNKKEDIIVSFSGGRTSGYMAYMMKQRKDINCHFVFANTGQEREETLEFVNAVDKRFCLNLVWVESVVHHGVRKSSTHKVVDFKTADRTGMLFEEMIKKYGIPNMSFPHCTRELKANPIDSWAVDNGLKHAKRAIGIRVDEIDRMSSNAEKFGFIYPLVRARITKDMINEWWAGQSFDLNLEDYEGNCKWCWKKTDSKLFRLYKERPEIFVFPLTMEIKHPFKGAPTGDKKRVFFRKNRSTIDLINEACLNNPHPDDIMGCEDHCEPFADE